MSDEEFWEHVFATVPDYEPDPEDEPDMTLTTCLRCGNRITVEDYEDAMERWGQEFCDECACEMSEEPS
jgi:hypothetical protein